MKSKKKEMQIITGERYTDENGFFVTPVKRDILKTSANSYSDRLKEAIELYHKLSRVDSSKIKLIDTVNSIVD